MEYTAHPLGTMLALKLSQPAGFVFRIHTILNIPVQKMGVLSTRRLKGCPVISLKRNDFQNAEK